MRRISPLAVAGAVHTAAGLSPPAERTPGLRIQSGAFTRPEADVAAEVPIALVYNGISHVVMMATPADIEDFALGFSLSEGILEAPNELLDLEVVEGSAGIEARMTILERRFAALKMRRRNLVGRTGCGLCGVDSLAQIARPVAPVRSSLHVESAAIHSALADLPSWQALNRATGAVHAAAWADPHGRIQLVREDVGRHNALDKLIGVMARERVDPASGFAVITSRCSSEMVQKAATVGIGLLVAISAPTTLALRIAEDTGVTVVALARADSITVYAHPGRIRETQAEALP